jgi:hypothetical protein
MVWVMRIDIKHIIPVILIVSVPNSLARTLSTTVIGAAERLQSNSNISQVVEETALDLASEKVESELQDTFSNTEVSIDLSPDGKNTIGILTVQPLSDPEDISNTIFGQGSLFSSDGRHTLNLGLGYRRLTDSKNWIYGINAFYDHEFPYDHSRASVGLEIRSSVFELNANEYVALSGWKTGKNSIDEHALDGRDLEVGFAIPYMPSSRIYYKQFQWDALNGADDLKGQTTSLEISGDILVPGLSVSLGQTTFDGNLEDVEFVRLDYRLGQSAEERTPLFSKDAFQFESMEEKRFEKVRRENQIVKQTRTRVVFRGR